MAGLNSAAPLAWVTGAGGLIGRYLVEASRDFAPGWRIRGLTRADLDLTDVPAVREAFRRDRPDLVLHCAALSRSPACQGNPALARRLNVEVTELLGELAHAGRLVLFSTDLVFDGVKGGYVETDEPRPLSVYAETKLAAEAVVLANPAHLVVRTSLNGGVSPTGDRGFNEELHRAWASGRTLRLFTDEFRCPIPAAVTARAVWELVGGGRSGLFHLAGAQRLSRYATGELLARRWPGVTARFEKSSLREYAGAPRAPDTSLDCGRVQALLSFPLPGLAAWLAEHPDADF